MQNLILLLSSLAPALAGEGADAAAPRPVVLLQVAATAWDADSTAQADPPGFGDPEADPGIGVQRARLGMEGDRGPLTYRVVFGVAAPSDGFQPVNENVGVIDASVLYRAKGLYAEAGRQRIPFSRDELIGTGERTFMERGFVAQYVGLIRATGVRAGWRRKGCDGGRCAASNVQAGVFNSGPGLFGDDNAGKTLVVRAETSAWSMGGTKVDETYRTWTPGPKRGVAVGVGGGGFYTQDLATDTLTVGADTMLRSGRLSLLLDGAWQRITPTATDLDVPGTWSETTRTAATAQVGVAWKAWEPAVRWTLLDDSALGAHQQLMAGAVWHGSVQEDDRDAVRVGGAYIRRIESPERSNDSVRVWAQMRY
ncbi:MAG: Phosphate-selective porin [Pseudomonadota bacterium]|jgi:hypothetical protein